MRGWWKVFIVIVALCSTTACSYVFGRTITLQVVGQNGDPVPRANVGIGFLRTHGGGEGSDITDYEGVVSIRGNDLYGARTTVEKEGYYETERRIGGDESIKTKILLREKRNPTPMYVREDEIEFYKENKLIGYDLVQGDWVSPHGEGRVSHIMLSFVGDKRGRYDKEGKIKIRFPNGKGGLKEINPPNHSSELQFPYMAPESGYKNEVNHYIQRRPPESNATTYESSLSESILGYAFKSVVEVDEEGAEKKAYYGKILGEMIFSPLERDGEGPHGFVRFTFYLNPKPDDRNIEFDPSRNLFSQEKLKREYKTFPP